MTDGYTLMMEVNVLVFLLAFHHLCSEARLKKISGSSHVLVAFLPLQMLELNEILSVRSTDLCYFFPVCALVLSQNLLKDFHVISILESLLQDVV
jgi:hypothetical protein